MAFFFCLFVWVLFFSFLLLNPEDTEVFRVKKSNHSKKIVKQLKKEYREEKSTHVVQERLDGS